ncbi:MAG: ATP-dependent helicase HrpB [Ectothiorhodospiraceae bacterium]|nr:ATP-dependent helicase HrpB [Ectothiorhodospiraceae bacterium]
MTLPVDAVIPDLLHHLRMGNRAVLQAPPGAGKTTRIPLALMSEPWLGGRRIVMLEPRRLAARAAAAFMSRQLGETVGQTVGYRIQLDSRTGPGTRVEVVTEGVLTRMLQNDPALSDYGAVIFDEFHERSMQGDLGLALTLDSQGALREDLRLLVMSATLDGERIAALLGGAPVLSSRGRSHPVALHYRPPGRQASLAAWVAATTREALKEEAGSILVFLPGQREIRQVMELLSPGLPDHVRLLALFGDLPPEQQDLAIAPAENGLRKLVLATNIAETSLTIEGVRVVVDAGLQRSSRFDPSTGMSRLVTTRISHASAEQRAGRAGRTEPGSCYRLWSAEEHARLQAFAPPEIADADLAPVVLELARWGVADPAELRWLDPPPQANWDQASGLLRWLGLLDDGGRITAHGHATAELGLHPRLGHMLLQARDGGHGWLACRLAALLSERDLLAGEPASSTDVLLRLERLERSGGRARRVLERARQLARRLRCCAVAGDDDDDKAGHLLMLAYPERLALRRRTGDTRYLLANGRGARLPEGDPLAGMAMLVAAHVEGGADDARVRLAAGVSQVCVEEVFAHRITEHDHVGLEAGSGRVLARRQRRLGALVLSERVLPAPEPSAIQEVLLAALRKRGLELLPWTPELRQLQARVALLRALEPEEWPDFGDGALLEALDDWVTPFLAGITSLAGLRDFPLQAALESRLSPLQQRRLREETPTHWQVPAGSRIRLDYCAGAEPVLAVRLQELFGCEEGPVIAGGRVPVLLHLLSPAGRPVQLTRDLAGFWRGSYHDVRKELRGRYPKHAWPDDPLRAAPLRGVPRRGKRA